MRQLLLCVVFFAVTVRVVSAADEAIVNKQDTDRIFSFNRNQWETYAQQLAYPVGWKARLAPVETGTVVMALDLEKRLGLSVQPLFMDDTGPPLTLVVGSYYPGGTFKTFSDDLKKQMQEAASTDLGTSYSVSVSFSHMSPFDTEFDVVEVTIHRASGEPKKRNK